MDGGSEKTSWLSSRIRLCSSMSQYQDYTGKISKKKKKNSESHFPHYLVEFLRIFSTFHLSRVPLYLKQEPLEIKP